MFPPAPPSWQRVLAAPLLALLTIGIGVYFTLPVEPPPGQRWGLTLLALTLAALGVAGPVAGRLPVMAVALVLGGVALAGWRAQAVAPPYCRGATTARSRGGWSALTGQSQTHCVSRWTG